MASRTMTRIRPRLRRHVRVNWRRLTRLMIASAELLPEDRRVILELKAPETTSQEIGDRLGSERAHGAAGAGKLRAAALG